MKIKREVKIGLFAVLMIGALWAGVRFLKGFDLLSRNVVYYAAYDQIDGVQHAAPVMIQGVKVGAVTDIRFDPMRSGKVVLQLTIKRQYHLPIDSEARIYSHSLMGSKALGIDLGSSPVYLQRRDTIRSGDSRDLMDRAGSELDFFKQKLSVVVADLSRTMENVNGLLERNARSIDGTFSHLNSITGEVDGLLLAQRENLDNAIANLSRFSNMLGDSSPRVDHILTNLDRFSGQLAEADLVGSLDATLRDLQTIMTRIEAGDGTLGKLVNDPALYQSLHEASENLASLLADVEAYPKRYVHVSVFGGGKKKVEKQRAADRATQVEVVETVVVE